MNSLQKTFLSMIRTALWDTPFVCEDGVKAAELFDEACRYEIAGVLSTKLDFFCKDDMNTRSRWSKKAMADYQRSLYILSAQTTLCRILSEENIKPIFLKGMASAFYYPIPSLRQIGDIDFLVLPEQFEACCRLLEQNGYEKGIDGVRHLAFEKQGIEYECHRYFSCDMTIADKTEDQLIYSGCRNCVTRTIESKQFYALPDAEYGIVLLEHLKHHLLDGVGFRQVMDWVVYADAVLDDNIWNSEFQKMACDCGLERLAKTMTRTAQIYLGLKSDNINWCRDVDETICGALVDLLFSCDNFGFANEEDKDIHKLGNIFRTGFFTNMNSSAMAHIPIAKKIVILRPFAWLYQLVRWSINGSAGLIFADSHVSSSVKKWQNQKKLLKQIGV